MTVFDCQHVSWSRDHIGARDRIACLVAPHRLTRPHMSGAPSLLDIGRPQRKSKESTAAIAPRISTSRPATRIAPRPGVRQQHAPRAVSLMQPTFASLARCASNNFNLKPRPQPKLSRSVIAPKSTITVRPAGVPRFSSTPSTSSEDDADIKLGENLFDECPDSPVVIAEHSDGEDQENDSDAEFQLMEEQFVHSALGLRMRVMARGGFDIKGTQYSRVQQAHHTQGQVVERTRQRVATRSLHATPRPGDPRHSGYTSDEDNDNYSTPPSSNLSTPLLPTINMPCIVTDPSEI
ncbi:hypothetical protein BKA62DRAFT_713492 [Auriculariales sp. MPI-PUGE-AT-0066]|nr:hypothetical protein BKA62DRAFT_713492 [Auriculariales sp. MPI-PUGE-AT-0066]